MRAAGPAGESGTRRPAGRATGTAECGTLRPEGLVEALAHEAAVMLLDGAVGDRADALLEAMLEGGAPLGCGRSAPAAAGRRPFQRPQHLSHRSRAVEHGAHR